MSTIRTSNIGALTGNTASVVDPGLSGGSFSPIVTSTLATTSGTSVLFTGIPSWVKRATFVLYNVTATSYSWPAVQIGSGGSLQTSGYSGTVSCLYTASSAQITNTGAASYLDVCNAGGSGAIMGTITVFWVGVNTYTITALTAQPGATRTSHAAGQVALSGSLERFSFYDRYTGGTFNGGTAVAIYE